MGLSGHNPIIGQERSVIPGHLDSLSWNINNMRRRIILSHTAAAKSLQSCPTLCDPIDGSPPGFPVPGILQARTLEWVAISFSNAWKWKVKVKSLSHVWLFATPWIAAHQAPPSMGFSRQENGVGCHCLLRCLHILNSTTNVKVQTFTSTTQLSHKFGFGANSNPEREILGKYSSQLNWADNPE